MEGVEGADTGSLAALAPGWGFAPDFTAGGDGVRRPAQHLRGVSTLCHQRLAGGWPTSACVGISGTTTFLDPMAKF